MFKLLGLPLLSSALLILFFSSCGNNLRFLQKEILSYGYIFYPTPLEYSGPGTLVGGSPKAMQLVAAPDTCFPDQIEGVPTDLRRMDRTTLPRREITMTVSGDLKLKLFNFLKTGNPVLRAGTNFSIVHSVQLEMSGVHIEYLDSIKLTQFYRSHLSPICKEYLEKVPFIVQAMKVEKLTFQFRSKSGQAIYLDLQNLESIVDIGANIAWEIQNNTTLIINSPKYIGYQLGSFRSQAGSPEGMVLYRATGVKWGKYVFRPTSVFKRSPSEDLIPLEMEKNHPSDFLDMSEVDDFDRHARYLPLRYFPLDVPVNRED